MADRPIIFSAPMVRALLEGRKTQTRRLITKSGALDAFAVFGPKFLLQSGNVDVRYAIGDRLYVRESLERANGEAVGYPADGSWLPNTPWQWRHDKLPSIHMPRRLSRLTLIVTDVRVQRLQEISEEDAIAEGIEPIDGPQGRAWKSYETYPDGTPHPHASVPNRSPITSYMELWNSLHGVGSWDANPWIVAITFYVAQRNIDAAEAQAA